MRRPCFPNSGSHQHGPPLLGRVRTPPRSPTSTLLCSPPTPSSPSAAAPVIPRQRPTSVRRSCSSPPHRCPRQPVQRRRHFYPGSPQAGSLPEEKRGDPRCLGHPLRACRGQRPRRVRTAPRPSLGAVAVAFRRSHTLGTRKHVSFVATYPRPTRSRAYASPKSVTVSGARLATGRAGSPFAGRVSHPLDDEQGFMKSSHTPFPLDQPCLVAQDLKLTLRSACK